MGSSKPFYIFSILAACVGIGLSVFDKVEVAASFLVVWAVFLMGATILDKLED